MGQYWFPVNITKREFVDPRRLASGLKLWEQLANHPGSGAALLILCAAMPEPRGGGDFDLDKNWHGPERTEEHHATPGPMPDTYPVIAKRTIGRWAGDRIALAGDYAQDGDLVDAPIPASSIYGHCVNGSWTDISDDVCRVIEHELCGQFLGDSVREWVDRSAVGGLEPDAARQSAADNVSSNDVDSALSTWGKANGVWHRIAEITGAPYGATRTCRALCGGTIEAGSRTLIDLPSSERPGRRLCRTCVDGTTRSNHLKKGTTHGEKGPTRLEV